MSCTGCNNPTPSGIGPKRDLRMARVTSQTLPELQAAVSQAKRALEPKPAGQAADGMTALEAAVTAEVLRALASAR